MNGWCARERNCPGSEVGDDGKTRGALLAGDLPLCDRCTAHAASAARSLERDYLYLSLMSGVTSQAGDGVLVNGSRELKVPLRLDVAALQHAIDVEVSTWVEPVAELVGFDWDTRLMAMTRPGHRISRAVDIIAGDIGALLRLEPTEMMAWVDPVGMMATVRSGVDGAQSMVLLHERALWWTQGNAGDIRLPTPCPRCEARVMTRVNGLDGVTCKMCQHWWAEDEYRQLCGVLTTWLDDDVKVTQ